MFFKGTPHDDNVIKINQAGFVRKFSEDCFHKALECCRCIAQAERQNLKLPQSLSRDEGSFLFIVSPLWRFRVGNQVLPASVSSVSSILGKSCLSW
ncbi:hypothetical protein TNCV_382421 [Trichonephila clavipes]|nr:hypothetical protein TNCV_382421 [Trichonephila clavipes]